LAELLEKANMPLKQWPDIPVVPNREILIAQPRLYTQKSVQAGETLDVRLSSSSPYKLSIARLGWDFNTSAQDWILQSLPQAPAIQRSIRPGSYIHVTRSLDSDASYPGSVCLLEWTPATLTITLTLHFISEMAAISTRTF
jgi:hypothetical protein